MKIQTEKPRFGKSPEAFVEAENPIQERHCECVEDGFVLSIETVLRFRIQDVKTEIEQSNGPLFIP